MPVLEAVLFQFLGGIPRKVRRVCAASDELVQAAPAAEVTTSSAGVEPTGCFSGSSSQNKIFKNTGDQGHPVSTIGLTRYPTGQDEEERRRE